VVEPSGLPGPSALRMPGLPVLSARASRAAASGRALLFFAVGILLTACQRDVNSPEESVSEVVVDVTESFEGNLHIIAWPGYVERGETDPAYDWVSPFENETGCKLQVTTASSSDEMVALMTQGNYDLVTAAGDASLRLIRSGLVQPIDLGRIPSYANVDPRLKEARWHYVDGKHYGTPYLWARNVLMYDTSVFARPPQSLSVLFEAKMLQDGRSNRKRIQAYASPISIADAALYLMQQAPGTGITDPYELNEAQYAAALDLVRRQSALVQSYWHNIGEQILGFTSAGVVAAVAWPQQVKRLQAAGRDVAGTVPAAGATGRADTTMLATDARHPVCAYRWMEWSLNATVQGDAAAWTGSVPAVPAACDGNALLGDSGCAANGIDDFENTWFWRTPEPSCAQGTCVPYARWVTDYLALIGGT